MNAVVRSIVTLLGLSAALFYGCGRHSSEDDGRLRVVVSIPPQRYLAERIAGELASVETLVGPGQSPHTFEPTLRQSLRISQANVWFSIGLPFERELIAKLTGDHPELAIVPAYEGIELRRFTPSEMQAHAHHDHGEACSTHGNGHEEHEEFSDPHIWLTPRELAAMAANMAAGLARVDPDNAEAYRANLTQLKDELDALDAELAEALAPLQGRSLFVYHPAFGYFADRYGLTQVAFEIEGRQPSLRQLNALIQQAKTENARVVFVQPQFAGETVRALAEQIGAAVIPLDPLDENVIDNLRTIAKTVREHLDR